MKTRHKKTQSLPLEASLKTLLKSGDWEGLSAACAAALKRSPKELPAHRLLGFALSKLRRQDEAISAYANAIKHWPRDAELLTNYSNYLMDLSLNAQALPLLRTACALRADEAKCWIKLSQACYGLQLAEEGLQAAERAIETATIHGERVGALNMRAINRRELGQVQEAVRDCEEALALSPNDIVVHSNRMLFMLANPDSKPHQQKAAALEYASSVESTLKEHWPKFSEIDHAPWRKLRIGFLSPDFRNHAVMYFTEGLLAQLDRRQFEVWAFHLHPASDHITERVKLHADHFVSLANLPAEEQAQAIRQENIDILIDLAGHTGNNGLLAMAQKPAPIQISWIGFPATTGLSSIDYKFTDEVTDLPGSEDQYTEKLYRLPTLFCCYRPLIRNPLWRYRPAYQVQPTPALKNGYITFGSCNNLGKLTDEVLALWGQLLQLVPESRLLIEGKNFHKPDFATAYKARCGALGIDTSRVELLSLNPAQQYLTYHRIDIALDPFPLTGGTTSFDVLWMGVPLVSMVGDAFRGRLSTGILTKLGRTEWLANTKSEYVEIALQLASDVQALNRVRLDLRPALEDSVLMREDLFTHYFGEGLRAMWLQWLANSIYPDDEERQGQQVTEWIQDFPTAWQEPATKLVGIEKGIKISLTDAHAKLNNLVNVARTTRPTGLSTSVSQADGGPSTWVEIEVLAEKILCAHPHDAVALTALAEIELAHGNEQFAMTYARCAQESLLGARAG